MRIEGVQLTRNSSILPFENTTRELGTWMNRYPLRAQMLQLHSMTVAPGSLSGGEAVTVYTKAPQWHDELYVAVGASAAGAVGRVTSDCAGPDIVPCSVVM